jgi:hypothetical protein
MLASICIAALACYPWRCLSESESTEGSPWSSLSNLGQQRVSAAIHRKVSASEILEIGGELSIGLTIR